MTTAQQLESWLETKLILENPHAKGLKDYCPNGLQVEGKKDIKKIVFGVTASLEFLERAIASGADAVVVHHGLIWNFQDRAIRRNNILHKRLKTVMDAELNVFAYHLPLDVHEHIGNNIALARALGLPQKGIFVDVDGIYICGSGVEQGEPGMTLGNLVGNINVTNYDTSNGAAISSRMFIAPGDGREIKTIAICTGAAGMYFENAINNGADVYISGEISEQHWHIAKETGVAYIAAGHHFTESFGVQELMQTMKDSGFYNDVELEFLNVYNPI